MPKPPAILGLILAAVAAVAGAETPPTAPGTTARGWRPTRGVVPAQAITPASPTGRADAVDASNTQPSNRRTIARVSKGPDVLPNDHGQILREYDIRPYTARVSDAERPEQAVVDWILRETGYEVWHSEPLGFLSADRHRLRVYHTPDIHAVVAEIVDRFVNNEASGYVFGLRVVTVGNPNWRSKAMPIMQPVPVQSQGVQAWLLAKEDAAFLLAELRNRSDYREHSSPNLVVANGQTTEISAVRPRQYVRGVLPSGDAWPGYNPDIANLQEGYSLKFTPLLSLDTGTVDAVVRLQLNQVERMVPVMLEVPTPIAPRQRTRIEVPQMTMCNLHERFRWPASQVLLLSMGVVASPGPTASNPLTSALALTSSPPRADALLFVENKGKVITPATKSPAVAGVPGFSGRY